MFSFSVMLLMFRSVFFPPEFEALATLPIENYLESSYSYKNPNVIFYFLEALATLSIENTWESSYSYAEILMSAFIFLKFTECKVLAS